MLAPMIRETPAAIEKNAVAEGMSRMMGREVKGTLQHEPDPARLSLLFAIIRWPVPKRKAARRGRHSSFANSKRLHPTDAHAGKPLPCAGNTSEGAF